MTIKINNPFALNEEKIQLVNLIIEILRKYFPNHQVSSSTLYIGEYRYTEGPVSTTKIGNAITEVHFGILTPNPPDTRRKLFNIAIGEPPKPKVIGAIHLKFREGKTFISYVNIEVYGLEYLDTFTVFTNEFEGDDLWHFIGEVQLTVESQTPRSLY